MTAQTQSFAPPGMRKRSLDVLMSHADETRAASYQRYFKEPVHYLGVAKEKMAEVHKDLLDRVEGVWTIKEAVRFCDLMVKDPHMEARGLGFRVVADFVPEAPPTLLSDIKRWLETACGNWGLVDSTPLDPGAASRVASRSDPRSRLVDRIPQSMGAPRRRGGLSYPWFNRRSTCPRPTRIASRPLRRRRKTSCTEGRRLAPAGDGQVGYETT